MIMKKPSTVTSSTGQGLRFVVVISNSLLMTDYSLHSQAKFFSSQAEHLVPPFVRGILGDQPDRGEDVHQHSAGEERGQRTRRGPADLAGDFHQPVPARFDLAAHVLVRAGGI